MSDPAEDYGDPAMRKPGFHYSIECEQGECAECDDEDCCCMCHVADQDDAEEIYQQDRLDEEREIGDPREAA